MTTFYFIKISKLRLSAFFAAARFLASSQDLLAAGNLGGCYLLLLQGTGGHGIVVENSTCKDVSQESRDRILATVKWRSLTYGHLLVIASCHRNGR